MGNSEISTSANIEDRIVEGIDDGPARAVA
jgi:hypothetical protein